MEAFRLQIRLMDYGDVAAGYTPESDAVLDTPADADTGAVEGDEY